MDVKCLALGGRGPLLFPPHAGKATTLFSRHTKAIVWGMQTRAVQGMLDFDYVCSRDEPSVAAMVYPFTYVRRASVPCEGVGAAPIALPVSQFLSAIFLWLWNFVARLGQALSC